MTSKKTSGSAKKSSTESKTERPMITTNHHKVFDVAHPGKGSAASATSRPTIVPHRSVAHDPMMIKEAEDPSMDTAVSEPEKPLESPRLKKLRIEPLHHDDDDSSESIDISRPEPKDGLSTAFPTIGNDSKPEESEKEVSETTTPEPAADELEQTPEQKDTAEEPSSDDIDEMNEFAQQAANKKAKKTAAAEDVKRQQLTEKLIESKKYFVPIKRPKKHGHALIVWGLVLLVVAAAAGAGYLYFLG